MEEKKSYTNLDVWKKSRKLTNSIYNLTKSYPKEETYGLSSQIRRCAISIPSNIAEGCGIPLKRDKGFNTIFSHSAGFTLRIGISALYIIRPKLHYTE